MIVLPFDVPVDPDADEARELLINELSGPQYQAARPTLFDQIAQAFWDWLNSLEVGSLSGPPAFGLLIVVTVIVIVIVVAFFVFGLPRLNRRSKVAGALFGEDDARGAEDMRRDARAAAARSDWSTAIAEMFRAVARGLSERGVLTTSPGTTASGFAAAAGAAFPDAVGEFGASAHAFDEVRYLGREGTREQYEQVAALDARARKLTTRSEAVPA